MTDEKPVLFFSSKLVLLDIEGTTTSISFVKDVLFPYARKNIKQYLENSWDTEECIKVRKALKDQYEKDIANDAEAVVAILDGERELSSIVENVLWQMDNDRKTTALKLLQGLIWRDGYESHNLISHVYDDVVPALKMWIRAGQVIAIYSSGSIEAQKLLFQYTAHGNLLHLIHHHYDTTIGSKLESASYNNIAEDLEIKPDDILFLTDMPPEAAAAKEVGCQVVLVDRVGNIPIPVEDRKKYDVITDFSQINFL